ncbi:MAG TPA: YggS family pyridoxal phosphate-dependent enzyme, partial [Terriglobales bacterium]|nr:YggS family pyridoxal phosphate-dependent enzyme [Terriglobales bacterium]
MPTVSSMVNNLSAVRERIAEAARHAGRRPEEIELMAATKTFPPALIRQAYEAGQRLFGENRV